MKLEEYKEWYSTIKETKDSSGALKLLWSLMKSPFVEYHYELIKENSGNGLSTLLMSRFDEHGEKGEAFLLKKLDNNEDVQFQGQIIYLLGKINKVEKEKILQYARDFTTSENTYTRDRAVIVLGWIGGVKELTIISDRLLNDTDKNCRAWAASAYMQMWFKRKSKTLRTSALMAFGEALKKEEDYFVISIIIGSLREIENKKFGISQTSLDDLETEKIDEAKARVERYIAKQLK